MSDQSKTPSVQSVPNNFPREGQHNTVTKSGLARLEAERAKPNDQLNYTIGGATETHVHTSIEADRNHALTAGHKRLSEVSEKLQTDHVFAANKGHAQAQFQAANDSEKPYAQRQREAASKIKARIRMHSR